jgi:hypothetical protein
VIFFHSRLQERGRKRPDIQRHRQACPGQVFVMKEESPYPKQPEEPSMSAITSMFLYLIMWPFSEALFN